MGSSATERSVLVLSGILFIGTAYWRLRKIREENKRKANSGKAAPLAVGYVKNGNVSKRCMRALAPATSYLEAFISGLHYPCDPEIRPDGYVAFCMAENRLLSDVLATRLLESRTSMTAFSDPIVYGYHSFLGLPIARQAAAYFIARHFFMPEVESLSTESALTQINPEHVSLGAGAVALLNALFFLLGDEGDACLIPAPYYAAFENDMSVVASIVPFAVHMANPVLGPTESELDLAFIEARSQGLNPKFLLLTNPNNPLGVMYKPAVIRDAVTWARKRKLHTIMDELYALSTHRKHDHGFESIVKILNNQLDDDVHMVWSVSKDFGASGLRVGFVYSQNETFIRGLANLNVFAGVSNPIQMVVAELLTDDTFTEMYLDESRRRLKESYMICVEKLEEMVLPFVPAEAGMFVYADFSSLLPEKSMDGEARLSRLFIDHGRLVLTPGESQRERMPGMFRICYAWVSPDVLRIGMERLSRIVAKIRRLDWSDLNEKTLAGVI